jgi:hypothetical protein
MLILVSLLQNTLNEVHTWHFVYYSECMVAHTEHIDPIIG